MSSVREPGPQRDIDPRLYTAKVSFRSPPVRHKHTQNKKAIGGSCVVICSVLLITGIVPQDGRDFLVCGLHDRQGSQHGIVFRQHIQKRFPPTKIIVILQLFGNRELTRAATAIEHVACMVSDVFDKILAGKDREALRIGAFDRLLCESFARVLH